jgi:hypothetical protein
MGSKAYLFAYAAGVFTIAAAILDWDWFFENYKARFFVDALGRNGARVFYGVLGAVILFLGSRMSG